MTTPEELERIERALLEKSREISALCDTVNRLMTRDAEMRALLMESMHHFSHVDRNHFKDTCSACQMIKKIDEYLASCTPP